MKDFFKKYEYEINIIIWSIILAILKITNFIYSFFKKIKIIFKKT